MAAKKTYGGRPVCRFCGKTLHANCEIDRRSLAPDEQRWRRVYNGELWVFDPQLNPPPADPSQSFEQEQLLGSQRRGGWDAKKQKWYIYVPVRTAAVRKYSGTFGYRGDSLFCSRDCGYRWAVRKLKPNRDAE